MVLVMVLVAQGEVLVLIEVVAATTATKIKPSHPRTTKTITRRTRTSPYLLVIGPPYDF